MAGPLYFDRVRETTTTQGTGNVTLAGPVSGFQAVSARFSNGDTAYWFIADQAGPNWEAQGPSAYNTASNTITRTAGNVLAGSAGAGVLVNFGPGVKDVFLDVPANRFTALLGVQNPNLFWGGPTTGSAAVPTFRSLVGSGSTLPTSVSLGDLFLHAPTGRTYLMQHDGSTWQPVRSYGAATVYVDGTNGTDSQNQGFGTGASAYRTIQYAINQTPGIVGGDVTVNIAAGTYAEAVTIRGKTFTDNYTITLTGGTFTQLDSLTAAASTQGSGATQGTVVRNAGTWTANQRQNKWVRFTSGANSGTRRLIDSNTTTTLTIAGTWPSAIAAGDTFVVEDIPVTINGATTYALVVTGNQQGIVLAGIKLTANSGQFSMLVEAGANLTLNFCQVATSYSSQTHAVVTLETSLVVADPSGLNQPGLIDHSMMACYRTKWDATGIAVDAITVRYGGQGFISDGSIIDGSGIGNGANGVNFTTNGAGTTYNTAGNVRIRNWSNGILANYGGMANFTDPAVYIVFSSNTVNKNADATTFGAMAN